MDSEPDAAPRVDWAFELHDEPHELTDEAAQALSRAKVAAMEFRERVMAAEAAASVAEDAIRAANDSGVSVDALAAELNLNYERVSEVLKATRSLLPKLT